ncbi:formylglycine-generating enzyme family protein [Flavobacterium sp. NRK F10]|uniref:Formylglycine-generating enzyme family protein n=1 Tax=Flavobacterium sediminis TaxID=2201181 RepID=A0A2U8QWM8_9FLAO|nr:MULTISPECIES: SUMF1/EgtB/PvdO family nonheme iron enzyme [Flavobacterium]AWM14441.1 formylglycine-generating enzyme family protein [Flavobacterium sediminis]MCO6175670.1 formylglycine-generating enzyme family protein [Flavobacterium sp. NRK F10]
MKKITLLSLFLLLTLIFLSNSSVDFPNPSLIKVEGGSFKMGSKGSDALADIDEQKEHDVQVNSFLMSKFEVTVWEWKQFVKANKLNMPPKPEWGWHDNLPINNVTWEEAVAYCNWLSKKEKLTPVYSKRGPNYVCNFKANGYRLPTEAEWEYAAKGGKTSKKTKYSGGDEADKIAWHKSNSKGAPHTVGTKLPNELGIYDMSGNVWEWCWDWYNQDYYLIEAGNNPKGPEMGERRSVRGGSWDSKTSYLRPANRISTYPNKTHEFYGFRVARSLVQ